ncbi:leucyl aminopeptidase [Palleronia aestuarii]|uniref:Probable cytosol aminopeptidase n=1 Tax=Palleronia aestuarii TaxID=568105 RepID=A0A2W7ND05_9RHOB|nr:leucyl aminopeptidase [Palleronia aestuarii]PZX17503.1 leucyl aminopeptidase [Palleronia aestuarii]
MTRPAAFSLAETDLDTVASTEGRIAVLVDADGKLDPGARRVNRQTKGALARFVESEAWGKIEAGQVRELAWPVGLAAQGVIVARLATRPTPAEARETGVAIAKAAGREAITILGGSRRGLLRVVEGVLLRRYDYADLKSGDPAPDLGAVTLMCAKPDELRPAADDLSAAIEGVFFARDLVNAPANVLTTTSYAERLAALAEYGLEVEVLEEDKLAELGMGALLAVGQGSDSPSKVVVMRWSGGGEEQPFALLGKGVVFDTGGISLKPAAGMEGMTMDMGGSAVVAGVMKTLALRKAKANVVGIVGLVENMPSGGATRPGDVVTSMKGDTIEVINTDAEGRLVLCDIMWYAQDRFQPTGMIDLATLTGAIIIGLGHENAGVFSNDDSLCGQLLGAAEAEGEGAWRMPLGKAYADQLKSRIADVKNVGGRPAGSITAAEFLHRFVKDGLPWCHIDIAGVASTDGDSPYAPKGASGWGVRALDRLVRDTLEG